MGKINETLIELILKNLIKIKNNKSSGNTINKRRYHKAVLRHKSSIAAIAASIAINSLKATSQEDENQANDTLERTAAEEPENKEEKAAHGGYGTIKPYAGMSPHINYVNYGKIWGHIGSFASKRAYETSFEKAGLRDSASQGTGILVENEVIEKAQKHFKYFVRGDIMGDIGYVPPTGIGIDSKDWEKFRLMTQMSVYMPLLKLFRSIV